MSELETLKSLEEEINIGITAYDCEVLITRWFRQLDEEEREKLVKLGFNIDNYWEFFENDSMKPFHESLRDYGMNNIHLLDQFGDDNCAAVTKSNATLLRNQWLINFSPPDYGICEIGFTVGLDIYQKEGKLTNYKNPPKQYGWNFAYDTDDLHPFDVNKRLENYGQRVNLFRANCVKFHHDGDREYQTMFLGEYVKRTYCIYYDPSSYNYGEHNFTIVIENKEDKRMDFEKLHEAIEFIQNCSYKNKIYGYRKGK